MTISKLATSQYITDKHWGYRDPSQIKYIIPHYMNGAGSSGAYCAQYFCNNGYENSANYCIGVNGDISCNVPEEYGAWTSSFSLADKYAITIEVSNKAKGDATIPTAAQESMIKLMVDLIQRYPSLGGGANYIPSDEAEVVAARRSYRNISCKGNVLLHVWTSAYGTDCPGWHLKKILPDICTGVNRRLKGGSKMTIREAAKYVIDHGINGKARLVQAAAWGIGSEDLQAEIDLMLAKDKNAIYKSIAASMPVVKSGSTGDAVKILQKELARMGYYNGFIDGQCGPLTVNAIKEIQHYWNVVYKGFAVDGSFGPQCWKQLLGG